MIELRAVVPADLEEFFSHQLDPSANHMAAFSAKNPADRGVFDHHWQSILNDPAITVRTIVADGEVVGSILAYRDGDIPEISYWIDKEHWGQGLTTAAVGLFLEEFTERPIRARAVADNASSIRILEKYGFTVIGETQGFANARGAVVKELELELN
ncbi:MULTISPECIES: GNAT family N-acetyltransferase [unclassified Arthrobacter]|uniref:GNAT family N-acetyltransferase n=1 Tax=unclassified Arthrobacter TaxID=235627 RepID=UPI0024DFBCF3|nr:MULTISPECIES: GNAT family N-acetyltransferase [unclassified Arthrobacter]MCC9146239.1 GNAT family N-acetyltransferase [Arthrobacter sp. zg-Y919]MDK1277469.1 GNAT family N-acetyltransferase [Arthrobacter sp. zg.Y919]MDM7990392.1 GNAT family N-acetyltransferase [Arthrobacter sp. zg-Y877]WIB03960.1 GNAT family N-acetyltransferase [Arthrobacter sp. zg-Y919]